MSKIEKNNFIKDPNSKIKSKKLTHIQISKNTYKNQKLKDSIKLFNKYDAITGLPNNIYFLEKLNTVLTNLDINNDKGAIIYLDIDNYKTINDNWGYQLGNEILKSFSKLINNSIETDNFLARLNGDEFAIIIYSFDHITQLEEICNKIYKKLNNPFKINNHKIYITVSMGISIFPDNSTNIDELLKFCDLAMYKSKHEGKCTYTFFNDDIIDKHCRKALIQDELVCAINNNELELFYQPQINTLKNEIAGIEVLLRWNNKKLGNISPSEFIPMAEENGYITRLTNCVMHKALKQSATWLKKGYKFDKISVNVSPIQLKEIDFKDNILNLCSKYNIPNNFFEIEITESALIDVCKDKIKVLNDLIENGVNVAIDDFGTGYSSLSYLIDIPINTLKIDKIFIDNIENYKNRSVIKHIVNLSKDLKYKIITEGVETKRQLEILTDLGCNIIQGFYFSKPVPIHDMEKLLINTAKIIQPT